MPAAAPAEPAPAAAPAEPAVDSPAVGAPAGGDPAAADTRAAESSAPAEDAPPAGGVPPARSPRTRFATAAKFFGLFSDLLTPANVVALLAGALILVTGVTGGWDRAKLNADSLTRYSSGEEATAAPFVLSIDEAFWAESIEPLAFPDEQTRYLVLKARVRNGSPRSVSTTDLANALVITKTESPEMTEKSELPAPLVYRASDGAGGAIQPKLDGEYWLVWELDASTAQPSRIRVGYVGRTWRASTLDGGEYWADATLGGVQLVDVAPSGRID